MYVTSYARKTYLGETPVANDKRCVTMRSVRLAADGTTLTEECVDYVPLSILNDYVADARTRWQYVTVGDTPDAGPGGDDGATDFEIHLRDLSPAALDAAHNEHLASLAYEGVPLMDPVDAPSPVTMTVEEGS